MDIVLIGAQGSGKGTQSEKLAQSLVICDLDGSELYQRPDDRGEAVQKRLDIFFSETIRLLDYYHTTGKLVEVNGDQGIEQVQRSLMQAVKSR